MLFIHVTNKNSSSFIYFKLTTFAFFSLLSTAYLAFILLSILAFSLSVSQSFAKNQTRATSHDYVGNIWPVAKFRFTIKISCANDFAKNISGGWLNSL